MLTVSLNEIYSETYKALRSLEIDWGLAKDCANLSKWLANHDQYFLGSLLKTADLYKEKKLSVSIKENNLKKPLTAALMGLLLVEYVSAKKITWEGYLHSPKFMLASMSIIAQEQNISMVLKNSDSDIIAYTNKKNLYLDTNNFNNLTGYFFLETYDFNQNYNPLSIVLNQKSEVSKINSKCWDRLSSMAFETYVPESEASKSGAGY
tara:strand:+ start:1064 stop:1684 length:621 start_codon:yes stop_codon:yes gene_type:complete